MQEKIQHEKIQQENLLKLIRMTSEPGSPDTPGISDTPGANNAPVRNALQEPDWEEILKLAKEQAISGFVAKAAMACGATNSPEWQLEHFEQLRYYTLLAGLQEQLHALLCAENIDYVVLKGFAAAVYYPKTAVRTMGDIDIIVRPEDLERTYELLIKNGFVNLDESLEMSILKNGRHVLLEYKGVRYELHRYFVTPDAMPQQGLSAAECKALADEFNALILDNIASNPPRDTTSGSACDTTGRPPCETTGSSPCETDTFRMLPEIINGLVLMEHINMHIKSGLGLRQIIDWRMFATANRDAEWWDDFMSLAEHFNLATLTNYVNEFCPLYLGLDIEPLGNADDTVCRRTLRNADDTVCRRTLRNVDDTVCPRMLAKIFKEGNFGKSDVGVSSNMRHALGLNRGPVGWFKRLQLGGTYQWDAARRHKALRPFAWAYQLTRVVPQLIGRRDALHNINSEIKEAAEEHDLLAALGIVD